MSHFVRHWIVGFQSLNDHMCTGKIFGNFFFTKNFPRSEMVTWWLPNYFRCSEECFDNKMSFLCLQPVPMALIVMRLDLDSCNCQSEWNEAWIPLLYSTAFGFFSKVITCRSSVCFVFLKQRSKEWKAHYESRLCAYLEFQRKQLQRWLEKFRISRDFFQNKMYRTLATAGKWPGERGQWCKVRINMDKASVLLIYWRLIL